MDVIACIMEFSEFVMLARWRTVSHTCYRLVACCLRNRYNSLVSRFVPDVFLFNSLLFCHGAIVSGSVALRFFLPNARWKPTDLDIYVPYTHLAAFVEAITDPSGLNLKPCGPPNKAVERRAVSIAAGHHEALAAGDGAGSGDYGRIPPRPPVPRKC